MAATFGRRAAMVATTAGHCPALRSGGQDAVPLRDAVGLRGQRGVGVALDRDSHRVTKSGEAVELTSREFALLEYFMRHPGQVVSRQQILSAVPRLAMAVLYGFVISEPLVLQIFATEIDWTIAVLIAVGALISILGNLNGGFLAASRLPFAMAEQKELPQVLAKTHEKFKTPHIALILTAVVILIFTIQTSFLAALTISTITLKMPPMALAMVDMPSARPASPRLAIG